MLTIEEKFNQFSLFCQFLKRPQYTKKFNFKISLQCNEDSRFNKNQELLNNASKKRVSDSVKNEEESVSNGNPWNRKVNVKRKKLEDEKEKIKDALYHRLQMKINGFKKLRDEKKMAKKRLDRESKNESKRKIISTEKSLKKNQLKLNSAMNSDTTSKEEEMIFSKFDFIKRKDTNDYISKRDKLKKALKEIKKEENFLGKLMKKGKIDEAEKLQETKKWNNAFKKAEGIKVKDDTKLVERSIKKLNKEKIRHAKKWQERREITEKLQNARQEKRQRNIEKKKEEKKERRLKKLKKKGRILNLN